MGSTQWPQESRSPSRRPPKRHSRPLVPDMAQASQGWPHPCTVSWGHRPRTPARGRDSATLATWAGVGMRALNAALATQNGARPASDARLTCW